MLHILQEIPLALSIEKPLDLAGPSGQPEESLLVQSQLEELGAAQLNGKGNATLQTEITNMVLSSGLGWKHFDTR